MSIPASPSGTPRRLRLAVKKISWSTGDLQPRMPASSSIKQGYPRGVTQLTIPVQWSHRRRRKSAIEASSSENWAICDVRIFSSGPGNAANHSMLALEMSSFLLRTCPKSSNALATSGWPKPGIFCTAEGEKDQTQKT